jgi:anion-transporting  ArsA/GET3 family ATPase
MKISSLAIALSVIGVMIVAFAVGMSNFSNEYGITYSNGSIGSMNKLNKITNLSNDVRQNITKMQNSGSFFSQVDAFFSAGYSSLQVLGVTADYGFDVTTSAINQTYTGDKTGKISGALLSLVIIIFIMLIFVAIFLKAITKTDL